MKLFNIEKMISELTEEVCGTFTNRHIKPIKYQRIFK